MFNVQLLDFRQRYQYITVYSWKNTHVKRNYLI